MTEFDSALVVWGGADIHPSLYKHPMSRRCQPYAGRRDHVEWGLMKEAVEMEIPIFGVCRGAQMLCALAGGFLLQDVQGHAGPNHEVVTSDGQSFKTNSIHHQMMMPGKSNHEVVGWAKNTVGAPYIYRDDKVYKPDPEKFQENEFLYFPELDGYAIQWHPESMELQSQATQYILNYFRKKQQPLRKKRFWAVGPALHQDEVRISDE